MALVSAREDLNALIGALEKLDAASARRLPEGNIQMALQYFEKTDAILGAAYEASRLCVKLKSALRPTDLRVQAAGAPDEVPHLRLDAIRSVEHLRGLLEEATPTDEAFNLGIP